MRSTLLLAAVLHLSLVLPGFAQTTRPYNFVLIMADDLGANELACYGNKTNQTPNLDRLASEGTRFQTCWATPLCTPTRVMLMTGQYAFRSGYFNLFGRHLVPLPESPLYDVGAKTTFADVLKQKGYATALAGKWQLTGALPTLVRDCGFDQYMIWAYKEYLPPGVEHTGAWQNNRSGGTPSRYWNPGILRNGEYVPTKPTEYGPDLFCDFLIDFVRANKDKPFCAYWPMVLTHGPHDPTPDLDRPGEKSATGMTTNVRYMDHTVGRLVRAIDEAGLRENTIILFTADNGTAGAGKGQLTEAGVREPMIVRCPGTVKGGVVSEALVSLVDVLPTLADFGQASLPKDHPIDGKSFAAVLRGESARTRDWIFSFFRDGRMIRDDRYVLQGDGRMLDAAGKDVTKADDADVKAARAKFDALLKDLPGPSPEQKLRPQGGGNRRRNANGEGGDA
ncbi:MAG: sulfatase-like hydrolase/transferase [Planctomycetota bacterium]|nr:sulfatase-like hydrolase/transferase [Planctomycetota bacterium]